MAVFNLHFHYLPNMIWGGAGLDQVDLFTAFAGILSHLLYFRVGEHHLQGPIYVSLATTFLAVTVTIQVLIDIEEARATAIRALNLEAIYIASSLSSILIYRLFFHPLRQFRGPWLLKISKIFHVLKSRKLDNCLQISALREQYGDIVRTGPNELTLFSVEAFQALYGHGSRCTRGPWYDMHIPRASVTGLREIATHAKRRKVWDHAFSANAISQYEHRVQAHVTDLQAYLLKHEKQEVDATLLAILFTFDIMGDVAFGTQLNGVATERTHSAVKIMRLGLGPLSFFSPTPWLWHLILAIPGAMRPWFALNAWAKSELHVRLKSEPSNPDVFYWLLQAAKNESSVEGQMQYLEGDAVSAVVAGSDTTAAALAFLLYHLAKAPDYIRKIRAELNGDIDIKDDKTLQSLVMLNACITETLRLHPPVTGALPRDTPPDGLSIDGETHIPGNVTCVSLIYSMHHLPSSYPQPEDFIPERWTGHSPDKVGDKYIYAPFNHGRFRCVASRLALMELRLACAMIVKSFDFEFKHGSEHYDETLRDFRDMVTACPGPLKLKFERRHSM